MGEGNMGNIYDNEKTKKSASCMTAITAGLLVLIIPMVVIIAASLANGEIPGAVVCIILVAIIGTEIGFFIVFKKQLERINRYGLILEEDHDGVITFARLHEMTGIPENVIRKDFVKAAKNNFKSVIVDGDTIYVGKDDDYEDIICPTCGAKNTVRAGSSDKCNNCGSYLRRA